MKNKKGFIVVMGLLLLPLLVALLQLVLYAVVFVNTRKHLRDSCFRHSLESLQTNPFNANLEKLSAEAGPGTQVLIRQVPNAESGNAVKSPRRLVFSLKTEVQIYKLIFNNSFDCGAEAIWKNSFWQYEIVLDKF